MGRGDTSALSCAGSKAKAGGVRFAPSQPPEGAHGHVRFDEKLHDSAVMVTQEKDGSFLVKVGIWGTTVVPVPPWAGWDCPGGWFPSRGGTLFLPHHTPQISGGVSGPTSSLVCWREMRAPQEPLSLPGDSCDTPKGAGRNVGTLLPVRPSSTRFLRFGGVRLGLRGGGSPGAS